MKMAVAEQKQRRQVENVELACQRLGVPRIDFKQREGRILCAIRSEQPFPGAATAAACAREDHQITSAMPRVPASA